MRKLFGILVGVTAIFFATDSFSSPSTYILQKQLIHASGSTSTSTTTTTTPSTTRSGGTSHSPRVYSKKKKKSSRSKRKKNNIFSATTIGKRTRPAVRRNKRSSDIEDALDKGDSSVSFRSIEVRDITGKTFKASSISSGLDNEVRLNTVNGKRHIKLSSISYMKFGKRRLNRLDVTLKLVSGDTIKGSLYPQYIFEFESDGSVFSSPADKLSIVRLRR